MAQQRIRIKLDAPTIWGAVGHLSGVDQETAYRALNGDQTAAAQVADFRIQAEVQAKNAPKVFGNLSKGIEHTGTVMEEEAKFLTSAGQEVGKASQMWKAVRNADNKLGYKLAETVVESNNQIAENRYQHGKKINLLSAQHRDNLKIIDAKSQDVENQSKQRVADARKQGLTKPQQVQATMNDIHQNGSRAVRGVIGWVRNLFS